MADPDFASYSLKELLDIERHINRDAYPERYADLLRHIEERQEQERLEVLARSASEPEASEIPEHLRYRTFGRRFWAGFVDGLLLEVVSWTLIPVMLLGVPDVLLFIHILLLSVVHVAYFILMHAWYGQTLGKMATGVIVLDVSEQKGLSLKQACLRDIVPLLVWPLNIHLAYLMAFEKVSEEELLNYPIYQAIVITMIGWLVLELVTLLMNRKRRAVHDFIAGSVVVRLASKF